MAEAFSKSVQDHELLVLIMILTLTEGIIRTSYFSGKCHIWTRDTHFISGSIDWLVGAEWARDARFISAIVHMVNNIST